MDTPPRMFRIYKGNAGSLHVNQASSTTTTEYTQAALAFNLLARLPKLDPAEAVLGVDGPLEIGLVGPSS